MTGSYLKEKIYAISFYFVLFLEPLMYAYQSQMGLTSESGTLARIMIFVFGLLALNYIMFYKTSRAKNVKQLVAIIFIFALLYYATSIAWGTTNEFYVSHGLRWGSLCVSCVFLGVLFNKQRTFKYIERYIPYITIPLTIIIIGVSLKGGRDLGQYSDESGLNYQTMAYYLAFMAGLSIYYVILSGQTFDTALRKIVKYLVYVEMIIQSVFCAMAGGRGGLFLLGVETIFTLYVIYKRQLISRSQFSLFIVVVSIAFYIVADTVGLWNSAGFQRSFNMFSQQTGRTDDYLDALQYFDGIGHGLGSIFYTWGFYSHNFVVDLLVETGVLGTLFAIVFLYRMTKRLYTITTFKLPYYIVLLILMYGLVFNMFSGYWISTFQNWMAIGVFLSYFKIDYKSVD